MGQGFQILVFETAVLAALMAVAVVFARGKVRWLWLVGALVLAAATKAILFWGLDGVFGDWIGGRYNWEGKIVASIVLLGAALLLFRGDLGRVGLTMSQKGPAPKLGFLLAGVTAVATAAFMILYFPGTKSEAAIDMAYQATMPSIHEELWYRGILLGMLIVGLTPKGSDRAGVFIIAVAAIITALQFWAVHSIFTDGAWGFEFRPFWNPPTLVYGLLWVGVRIGTGSLVLPMLLHTWANCAGYYL